ncbi:hypothetical protein JOF56_003436 [Kibdelosporangium banguiense]|uniref:Uncharacterized protein n=1 Tax=Kibdelosporangium banguiense TaxID=1365924 RepID=A0ABS4TGT6_9PSEU|nr:hypothetical protein [Kibdelosporangium banguiense]MBP2323051.1 hypothetical protein [Kibdelosporangium banguiense]
MYDGFVFELEGLLDADSRAIPFARETLESLQSIAFVSSDAIRTPAAGAALLADLGINAHRGQVITSSQAAARQVSGLVPRSDAAIVGAGTSVDDEPSYPALLRSAVQLTGARFPLVVSHSLACVSAARLIHLPSALVLNPESDLRELLLCPPPQRPTFVLTDMRDMFHGQPIVDCDSRYWECEGWIAAVRHGRLRLYPGPSSTLAAGARVLCAAAWNWRGPELDVEPAVSLFTSLVG